MNNNVVGGYNVNVEQSSINNTNQTNQKNKKGIIKVLAIFGGICVGIIILVIVIFAVVSSNSNKLICKSSEGNITIMYNDETITGYTASGLSYDLDEQQSVAETMGIESYIYEFMTFFESNTTGSCTIKEK